MLSIVSIVCYLSPKTDVTYWAHLWIVDTVNDIMEKEKKHSQNTYHQEKVTLAFAAIDRFKKPESTIPTLIDNSIKERYETYPKVVHATSRVIHLIGKQGIALRGHREELNDSKPDNNPGNFCIYSYRNPTLLSSAAGAFRGAVSKRYHISLPHQSKWGDWHYWKEYHPSNTFRWSKKKLECTQFLSMRLLPPMTKSSQFTWDI